MSARLQRLRAVWMLLELRTYLAKGRRANYRHNTLLGEVHPRYGLLYKDAFCHTKGRQTGFTGPAVLSGHVLQYQLRRRDLAGRAQHGPVKRLSTRTCTPPLDARVLSGALRLATHTAWMRATHARSARTIACLTQAKQILDWTLELLEESAELCAKAAATAALVNPGDVCATLLL